MKPVIEFRPMVARDYADVVALWRASEGVELAEGDGPEDIAGYLARNPGLSRVASAGGRIVGAALCGHDGRRGLIYHLAVGSTHRGQGIGRRLVDECLGGLRGAGIRRCLVLVERSNVSGREFWIDRGFAAIDGAQAFGRDL